MNWLNKWSSMTHWGDRHKDRVTNDIVQDSKCELRFGWRNRIAICQCWCSRIVIDKPFICKALTYANMKDTKAWLALGEAAVKTSKVYTLDITKTDAIFDQLILEKIIKLRPGRNIPKTEHLKGKVYCKYHDFNKHATNNYVVFRDTIQCWIYNGKLKFLEKTQMLLDTDHFLMATVNLVDAHLPRKNGQQRLNDLYSAVSSVPKQSPWPNLKIDLSHNNLPTHHLTSTHLVAHNQKLSSSDSREPILLCSQRRSEVTITSSRLNHSAKKMQLLESS